MDALFVINICWERRHGKCMPSANHNRTDSTFQNIYRIRTYYDSLEYNIFVDHIILQHHVIDKILYLTIWRISCDLWSFSKYSAHVLTL